MNLQNFISEISEENEVWKDIPNYEDLYMISTLGRILAKEKLVHNGYDFVPKPCRLLKVSESDNRKSIQLYRDGKSKKFSISKLLTKCFLPCPDKNYILKFKDKNPLNCVVDNLIWCPKVDRHAQFITDDLEGEVWKDIPGYEGYYAASNKGRIKSLSREVVTSTRIIHTQDRIMITTPNVGGYLYVSLSKNNKTKKFMVHRLIGITFIENPNNYPHIDHIDTNPGNNCVENLRWVTPKLNMKNEITQQHLSDCRKGKINGSWNCSPIVQLQGDLLINTYPSIAEAERAGFCYSSIQRCLYGQYKQHKGYKWMYLNDYNKLTPEGVITTT